MGEGLLTRELWSRFGKDSLNTLYLEEKALSVMFS